MRSRLGHLAVAMVAAAGWTALGAGQAHAAGAALAVSPQHGLDTSTVTLQTSGPCQGGTNLQVSIYGRGFPAGGKIIVGNTATTAYPTNAAGGYEVPLSRTLADYANEEPHPTPLAGSYRFVLTCRAGVMLRFYNSFSGILQMVAPHRFAAAEPAFAPHGTPTRPVQPAPPAAASKAPGTTTGHSAGKTAGHAGTTSGSGATPGPRATGHQSKSQPGASAAAPATGAATSATRTRHSRGWSIALLAAGAALVLLGLGYLIRQWPLSRRPGTPPGVPGDIDSVPELDRQSVS